MKQASKHQYGLNASYRTWQRQQHSSHPLPFEKKIAVRRIDHNLETLQRYVTKV